MLRRTNVGGPEPGSAWAASSPAGDKLAAVESSASATVDRSAFLPSADLFVACAKARNASVPIRKVSQTDKEFHFQNWVNARMEDTGLSYVSGGRNSYPDFSLDDRPEGFEVKGLAFPGRWKSFDTNSRLPGGAHEDRTVFYVFGRYPARTGCAEYPVLDLVVCHGNFLSANHLNEHKNLSFRGFGSYGDLLVRDRKMYVAPTPFALTDGTDGNSTLITPDDLSADERLEEVGRLTRTEADERVVAYTFDLRDNTLTTEYAPNPSAGKEHRFFAYRLKGAPATGAVSLKDEEAVRKDLAEEVG